MAQRPGRARLQRQLVPELRQRGERLVPDAEGPAQGDLGHQEDRGKDNEAWDCRIYAYGAAMLHVNPHPIQVGLIKLALVDSARPRFAVDGPARPKRCAAIWRRPVLRSMLRAATWSRSDMAIATLEIIEGNTLRFDVYTSAQLRADWQVGA